MFDKYISYQEPFLSYLIHDPKMLRISDKPYELESTNPAESSIHQLNNDILLHIFGMMNTKELFNLEKGKHVSS